MPTLEGDHGWIQVGILEKASFPCLGLVVSWKPQQHTYIYTYLNIHVHTYIICMSVIMHKFACKHVYIYMHTQLHVLCNMYICPHAWEWWAKGIVIIIQVLNICRGRKVFDKLICCGVYPSICRGNVAVVQALVLLRSSHSVDWQECHALSNTAKTVP